MASYGKIAIVDSHVSDALRRAPLVIRRLVTGEWAVSYGQTSAVLLRGNVQLRLDERLFGDVAHALGITIVSF